MTGPAYPSIGLKFDIAEVAAHQAAVERVRGSYRGLAGDVAAAQAKSKGALAATAADSVAASAAAKASAAEQSQSFKKVLAEARAGLASRVAMTRQMFGDETAEKVAAARAQQAIDKGTLDFRVRMARQQAAEVATAARTETEAIAAARSKEVAIAEAHQNLLEQMLYDRAVIAQRVAQAEVDIHAKAVAQEVADQEVATKLIEQMQSDVIQRQIRDYEAAKLASKRLADAEVADAAKAAAARGKVLEQIEAEATRAGLSRSEYAALRAQQLGLTAEAAPFIARMKQVEEEMGHTSGSALKVRESFVIMREGLRGDMTRMAGSATILAQAFGLLKYATNPIVLAIAAVVGALGAFFFAMEQGAEEQVHMQNALELTGHFAAATADEVIDAARRSAAGTHESVGASIKAFQELVASGEVGGAALEAVGHAAVHLADLSNQSASKIADNFARMADDPVKAMQTLERQYHFLTDAQEQEIRSLVEMGDKESATAVLFGDFDRYLDAQTQHFGWLESAIRGTTHALGDFWQWIKDIGKGQTLAQQYTDVSAKIAKTEALKAAALANPAMYGKAAPGLFSQDIAALRNQQRQIGEQIEAADSEHQAAEAHNLSITGHENLDRMLTGLKENKTAASRAMQEYRAWANNIMADPTAGSEARSEAQYALSHEGQRILDARIQAKFAGGKMPGGHAPSLAGAANSVARVSAEVDGLRAALQAVSGDPLSEFAAKLQKAADVAGAGFSHGKATGFQDEAAALAEQKEFLSLTLQMAEASAKQQRQAEEAAALLKIQAQAQRDSNAAMDDYLAHGGGAAAMMQAQERQAEIQRDATHAQNDLAAAQQYGVSSTDDISAALLRALGPSHQVTAAEREAARILQERAKAAVKAKDAQDDLTESEKRLGAISDAHTATLQAVRDLDDYTAALKGGTEALIDYRLAQVIQARVAANPLPAGSTPTQQADNLAAVTSDETLKRVKEISNTEAQTLRDVEEQERLANETSRERQIDAEAMLEAERTMLEYRLAGKTITMQEALVIGRLLAETTQARRDTAALKKDIQDSIRDTFIKTGKLDFSALKQGIGTAIKQAIYDKLLASPIKIIVDAVVNVVTHGIDAILNKIVDKATGGQGGLQGFMDKLSGNLNDSIDKLLSSLPKSLTNAMSVAGQVVGYGQVGSSISDTLGLTPKNVSKTGRIIMDTAASAVGFALGGPIGAVLAVVITDFFAKIFGGKPSNNGALANFDTSGNFTGVTGDKRTDETTQAVSQIAGTVVDYIAQLKALGIDAAGVIKQVDVGTRDPAHIRLYNGQNIDTAKGDAQALADAIQRALLANAKYKDPHEQQLVQQMIAANTSLDQIAKTLQAYVQAQQGLKDIQLGLLKYTDPRQYAIQTTIANQIARRDQLKSYIASGFYTQSQINTLASTLPELEKNELADALSNLADSANGAAHSLADIQSEQKKILDYVTSLTTSDLSPLSPEAILAASGNQFFSDITAAKGGNFDALSNLTGDAQGYLGAAKSFYGSSGAYAAIFQTVQDALTSAGTASITIDAGSQAIVDAIAQLQQAVKDAGDEIVGAINDNTDTAAAGHEGTIGAVGDVANQVGGANTAGYLANLVAGGVLGQLQQLA